MVKSIPTKYIDRMLSNAAWKTKKRKFFLFMMTFYPETRDTNTKQNRNEYHRNWPGVKMKGFWFAFSEN